MPKKDEGNIRWGARIWIQTLESSSIGPSNWMCRKHRMAKVKDDIMFNPAQSFQAGEQLHTRSAHSIFAKHQLRMQNETTCHRGKQERDKLGDKLEDIGRQTGRRTSWETSWEMSGDKLGDKQAGTQGSQGLGKVDTPPNDGKQGRRQAGRQARR